MAKKKLSQKMFNVLKRICVCLWQMCVFFLVFEILSILYSNFVGNWGLRWIQKKKLCLGGSASLIPPVREGLCPSPGAPLPGPGGFWIEAAYIWLSGITGKRFWISPNSLGIFSTKSTISQKLKIARLLKLYLNPF